MTDIGRFVRCVALIGVMALVLGACDWSMFRYGPGLTGYNPTETSIGVANVATLTQQWRGSVQNLSFMPSQVVADGKLFIAEEGKNVDAFPATGTGSSCAGRPKTCAPLWSDVAPFGGTATSTPAVANGVVYDVSGESIDAFDANGTTNCSGVPKTCSLMWQDVVSGIEGGSPFSTPTIANGIVYVDMSIPPGLYAYDAAGITNCAGVPKTCSPLWTASPDSTAPLYAAPAIVNGVAYVPSGDGMIYAFDATGNTNCSGSPKTCTPLWTNTTAGGVFVSPAVSGGVLYATSNGTLQAYDATGHTNCSGNPKVCSPLWTATLNGTTYTSPAIANGYVYVGSEAVPSGSNGLYSFDARGITNCAGTPKTCSPLWTGTTGPVESSSPSVANGVVYVGSTDKKLYAFDAAGATDCTGSPKICSPLWTATTGNKIESPPIIANGWVYVSSNDDDVHAYALPTP